MKIKLIFFLLFISINLLGSSTPNEILKDAENKANEFANGSTRYIQGYQNRSSCYYECPIMKEGYFARVADIDLRSGKTQCYVYKTNSADKLLATVTNHNKYCSTAFDNLKNNVIPFKNQKTKSQVSLESYEDLKAIEDKYYKNYKDVGAGREFINVPKYMIAGLTVDEEIINIADTIKYNEIRLNPKYTLYPNSNAFNEDEFRNYLQKENNWLTKQINNLRESLPTWLGGVPLPIPTETERVQNSNMVASVKATLTNSVIFIMNFLNEYNEVMLLGKTFLLFTVLPITIGLAILSKITKKMSQVSDLEDTMERIAIGVVTMFLFYFSTTNIKTDESMEISQTSYHQMIRPILYKGADIADIAGQSVTKAYLKWKLREVGLAPIEVVNSTRIEKVKVEQEQKLLSDVLTQCQQTYNTTNLKDYIGTAIGLNQTYPPSENISRYSSVVGRNVHTNFYNENFLKDISYKTKHDIFSVSSCYRAERKHLENKADLAQYDYLIKGYELANKNSSMKKQIEILANMQYRNDVELGFTSLPLLATTSIAIDNIGVFKNPLGDRLDKEQLLKDYRQSGGYEVGDLAGGEGALTAPTNWILSNLSYMMLPVASGIENTVIKLFKNDDSHDSLKQILTNAVESAGSMKNGVFGIATQILKGLTAKALGEEKIVNVIAIFITILFMMYLISYLPIIAIAGASFSVIFFYYLSLELYYLAIPFLIAFAFATSQAELLKSFMKNGVILAFKPLLIVISIVMAIFAKDFFSSLNTALVAWQFEPMFALTQNIDLSTFNIANYANYAFADFGLVFFKGFLLLANAVISICVVFYLVLNGANMILDVFGIRDAGFDVSNSIGANVDNKTNQWNTPI